jgi:hypothetical protein
LVGGLLLAASALTPVAASATPGGFGRQIMRDIQDRGGQDRGGQDRGQRGDQRGRPQNDGGQQARPDRPQREPRQWQPRADQGDQGQAQPRREWRRGPTMERGPDRGPNPRWQRDGNDAPARNWNRGDWNRGGWNRGNRDGNAPPPPPPQQGVDARPGDSRDWGDRGWRGRRGDGGYRPVNPGGVPSSDWRRDDRRGDRNWDRDNDGRWDRGDRYDRRDDQRWDRRDDRRWDRSDRYGRHDRGWNRGYDRGGHRGWDRGWHRNNRYDWRGHRSRYSNLYRWPTYYSPYRDWRYRSIGIGFSLRPLFYSERYWINDPWQYRLPEVYGPYRWVRYYDDALLVDIYSGEVVDVINNFFW